MQTPLRGVWQCWVSYMGYFRTVNFKGVQIDHAACKSSSIFDAAVENYLVHELIDNRTLTYEQCCSGYAHAPIRCLSLDDRNGECPSLELFGEWFGLRISNGPGADKGRRFHNYYEAYSLLFSHYPASARLLEIGVAAGNSIAVWGAWFPHGIVVGLDIELLTVQKNWPLLVSYGANASGNIHLLAVRRKWLHRLLRISPQAFDIIVDDADHSSSSQLENFELLFEVALAYGGIYIIEDVSAEGKAAEYFQKLSLVVSRSNGAKEAYGQGFYDWDSRFKSGNMHLWIQELTFRRNMVVIRKISFYYSQMLAQNLQCTFQPPGRL